MQAAVSVSDLLEQEVKPSDIVELTDDFEEIPKWLARR